MSETRSAFAERTIPSLNYIAHHYLKDYGAKYIYKLTQFNEVLTFIKKCSIDLTTKIVKNSDFLSVLYSKTPQHFREPKFKIGNRVRISKNDLIFRKGYQPQFLREVFENVAFSSGKPPTYTKKDKQDETIHGKFYQKIDQTLLATNRSRNFWFLMRQHNNFRTQHSLLLQTFYQSKESGRSIGGCNFGSILPNKVGE